MRNTDEIYFFPHTLEICLGLGCQDLVAIDYNSEAACFQRYFREKKSYLGLEEALQ